MQTALSIGATATSLTVPTGTHPGHMMITVEDAAIRWRADGTAPTSTTGHELEDGDVLEFMDEGNYRSVIGRFQASRRDGVSASLQVSYYE